MHFIDNKHEINKYIAWYNEMGQSHQDLMEKVEFDNHYEWLYVHIDPVNEVCFVKDKCYFMKIESYDDLRFIIWLWQ